MHIGIFQMWDTLTYDLEELIYNIYLALHYLKASSPKTCPEGIPKLQLALHLTAHVRQVYILAHNASTAIIKIMPILAYCMYSTFFHQYIEYHV